MGARIFLLCGVMGIVACAAVGDDADFSFMTFLPTGRRHYVNNLEQNACEWPHSVLINNPNYEHGVGGSQETLAADPVFGNACFVCEQGFVVQGSPSLAQPPLTMRLRVKIRSANRFNIFAFYYFHFIFGCYIFDC